MLILSLLLPPLVVPHDPLSLQPKSVSSLSVMRAPRRPSRLAELYAQIPELQPGPSAPSRQRPQPEVEKDELLVGIGQGVCALPSKRKGMRCGVRCELGGGMACEAAAARTERFNVGLITGGCGGHGAHARSAP